MHPTTPLTQGNWQAAPGPLHAGEAKALLCVAAGDSNKKGAKRLGIAASTFNKNLQRVMYKLGTHNRAETVAESIRRGIITTLLVIFSFQNLMPIEDPTTRISGRLRPNRTVRITRVRSNNRKEA